jgi:hypothetical protein
LDTKNTKYDYDTIETIMRRYRWHMAAKKWIFCIPFLLVFC